MKDLSELVNIISSAEASVDNIFKNEGQKDDSKLVVLYKLLQSGQFEDENALAKHLYGTDKNGSAYKRLRNIIKNHLLNALFTVDLNKPSYKERQKAYYQVYKDWAAAKILFGKKAHHTALGVAFKILKIARKFEFTELVVDVSHTLRLYYSTLEGDWRKYEQYNAIFKYNEALWSSENLVEEHYLTLTIDAVKSKAVKTKEHQLAILYYKEVQYLLERYDSYQLHLYGRLIQLCQYTSINDYQSTLPVCDNAITFFQAKSYDASIPLQAFYYQKLISLQQLQQLPAAQDLATQCKRYFQTGKFNWFNLQAIILLVAFHQDNYQDAQQITDTVFATKTFDEQPLHLRESWRIFNAYLSLYEVLNSKKNSKEKFKIGRFLNEIEIFSKDKNGLNVAILLLDVIFNIIKQNENTLIDRMEAVDKYRRRYLQEEPMRRSNVFLKMLLLFPRNGSNITQVRRVVQPLLQELNDLPLAQAQQPFMVEVIPYQELWKMLMQYLQR